MPGEVELSDFTRFCASAEKYSLKEILSDFEKHLDSVRLKTWWKAAENDEQKFQADSFLSALTMVIFTHLKMDAAFINLAS